MSSNLNLYQNFIAKSRYSRYLEDKQRREHFPETVDRYLAFMKAHLKKKFNHDIPNEEELREALLNQDITPSMRTLMTAGAALEHDNICAYNCAYAPVIDFQVIDEALLILMNGTGFGYSVEKKYIDLLPAFPAIESKYFQPTITVEDSKEGWQHAVRDTFFYALKGYYFLDINTSKVRPKNSRLKTFGGRASGPEPLVELIQFILSTIRKAIATNNGKLTPLMVHEILCKVAQIVIVGGVRRSALLVLCDLDDKEMQQCKHGNWFETKPHLAMANISTAYNSTPSLGTFVQEWGSLISSYSGERGIFNREAARKIITKMGRRELFEDIGTNPCSEIILRPFQFCNLSGAVARPWDDMISLTKKVRLASQLGTYQSTLTYFPNLRKEWQENTEKERLLGVSFTGIFDCPALMNARPDQLEYLRNSVVWCNKDFANQLGIPQSVATTCIKPSGNESQLTDASSGLHGRFSPYYIRRVRASISDPLTSFMIAKGVPFELEIGKEDSSVVLEFPTKAPDKAVFRDDITAIEHLELWLKFQRHWCEHKPSVTIYVKEHEWFDVGKWVFEHFDEISGVSFLPYDGGIYKQAPYEEITEDKYKELMKTFPDHIDFDELIEYDDNVEGTQSLACTSGACEI